MTGPRVVLVAGVPLPAAELAQALDAYVTGRLMDERRRPAGGAAFRSAPWSAVVRRLENDAGAGAGIGVVDARFPPLVGCDEYGSMVGRSASTVRVWCSTGRLSGARRVGRDWRIPVTAEPPIDRRRRTS